jgi:hypothetical protein
MLYWNWRSCLLLPVFLAIAFGQVYYQPEQIHLSYGGKCILICAGENERNDENNSSISLGNP